MAPDVREVATLPFRGVDGAAEEARCLATAPRPRASIPAPGVMARSSRSRSGSARRARPVPLREWLAPVRSRAGSSRPGSTETRLDVLPPLVFCEINRTSFVRTPSQSASGRLRSVTALDVSAALLFAIAGVVGT
jgi:hypothetical protein